MTKLKKVMVAVISAVIAVAICLGVVLCTDKKSSTVNAYALSSINTEINGNMSNMDYCRLASINNKENDDNVFYNFEIASPNYDTIIEYNKNIDTTLKVLTIATEAVGLIKKIPGIKQVAGLVETFLKSSSVANVSKNTQDMMNQLSDQLTDVYQTLNSNIGVLSNQISQSTETLQGNIDALNNKIDYNNYINVISNFESSDFGLSNGTAAGYSKWKEEFLSKYNQLATHLAMREAGSAVSDATLKRDYDYLYAYAIRGEKLMDLMNPSSSLVTSVQDAYYYVTLLNNMTVNKGNADTAAECQAFVYDLYQTYLLSLVCVEMCYSYQLSTLADADGNIPESGYYDLHDSINSLDRGISVETMQQFLGYDMFNNISKMSGVLTRYYVYIYGINETYTVDRYKMMIKRLYNQIESEKIDGSEQVTVDWGITKNGYWKVNNIVKGGDVLHMNGLPEEITDNLGCNFTFESSDTAVASVTPSGVVTVYDKLGSSFTIDYKVKYYRINSSGEKETITQTLYSTKFYIKEIGYDGGSGSEKDPFIINSAASLSYFASNCNQDSNKFEYYKLVNDIDLSNIESIASVNNFYGVLDGEGHTIKNLSRYSGFIVANHGTIKNINYENITLTNTMYRTECWEGVVALHNFGTIENCSVKDSTLNFTVNEIMSSDLYYTSSFGGYVGGITSKNYSSGKIINCGVSGTTIRLVSNGYVSAPETISQALSFNVHSFVGGIAGIAESDSFIQNTYSYGNTIYSQAIGYGMCSYVKILGVPVTAHAHTTTSASAYAGGVVGCINEAHLSNVLMFDNTVNYSVSSGAWCAGNAACDEATVKGLVSCYGNTSRLAANGSTSHKSNMFYANDDEAITTLKSLGWNFSSSNLPYINNTPGATDAAEAIKVKSEPYQTVYKIGDTLNIAGLLITDSVGNPIRSGLTFSGFDSSSLGTKTVTVSYGAQSATFDVDIICPHTQLTEVEDGDVVIHKCSDCVKEIAKYTLVESSGTGGSTGGGTGGSTSGEDNPGGSENPGEGEGSDQPAPIEPQGGGIEASLMNTVACKTAGSEFTVKLNIESEDSSAIAYLKLSVTYSQNFELISVEQGSCLKESSYTASASYDVNPYVMTWTSTDAVVPSGTAVTLTFKTVNDVLVETENITLSAEECFGNSLEDVEVTTSNCTVTFTDIVFGDVNGDALVNGKDAIILARYLAGWENIQISSGADVNNDGSVNGKDAILLARYLAGWNIQLG
ncbi:MAG: dockerin type I domain-containing protein [Candidatus Coproplasma sp.]